MDFRFVHAPEARAVVSCKSELGTIDAKYPAGLKKYGVKKVLLVAECCPIRRFDTLRKKAKAAGYAGLWCLYLTKSDKTQIQIDDKVHVSFVKVLKSIAA